MYNQRRTLKFKSLTVFKFIKIFTVFLNIYFLRTTAANEDSS